MKQNNNVTAENFIRNYFNLYSARDLSVSEFITEDFIGLDGITQVIYNKEKWIEAIHNDF